MKSIKISTIQETGLREIAGFQGCSNPWLGWGTQIKSHGFAPFQLQIYGEGVWFLLLPCEE